MNLNLLSLSGEDSEMEDDCFEIEDNEYDSIREENEREREENEREREENERESEENLEKKRWEDISIIANEDSLCGDDDVDHVDVSDVSDDVDHVDVSDVSDDGFIVETLHNVGSVPLFSPKSSVRVIQASVRGPYF